MDKSLKKICSRVSVACFGILFLLILIQILGCTSPTFIKPQIDPPIENTTNTTEITPLSSEIKIVENTTNVLLFENSILVIVENKSYLIDTSTKDKITNVFPYLTERLEFAVSTLNIDKYNGGMKYVVLRNHPKLVMDNGLASDTSEVFIKYIDLSNRYYNYSIDYSVITLLHYIEGFEFYVPFYNEFSKNLYQNSISVQYNDLFLYMSDCHSECQDDFPKTEARVLILSNGGYCPTNDIDFVLDIGAEYVIGNNICEELLDELDLMSIPYYQTTSNGIIQILYNGTIEIRKEKG